jgi:hypothetical protein
MYVCVCVCMYACMYTCMHACILQDLDAGDERVMEQFMSRNMNARMTLADIIMAKIREKETEIGSNVDPDGALSCLVLSCFVLRLFV